MELKDYETTALRFIANAFEALEQETALGREQARLFSDRALEAIKAMQKFGVYGGIARERWIELEKIRRSSKIQTIEATKSKR